MKCMGRFLASMIVGVVWIAPASADGTYHDLASGNFSQNWTGTDAALSTNDVWTGVPSIIGYLGDVDAGSPTAVDPRTRTQASSGAVDVIVNQAANVASTAGGVAEFQSLANPVVALQGSGTADAPSLVLHLNTTGRTNVTLSYLLRDIDTSGDNATQAFALQYRIGNSGVFTALTTDGFVADASDGPSLTKDTAVSVNLSSATANAIDNQAQVEIRILTTNAAGNDEWVGIDDISVISTVGGLPTLTIANASVIEGDSPGCTTTALNFTVTSDMAAPAGGIGFTFSTADASATLTDNDYTQVSGGAGTIAAGATTGTATVNVTCDKNAEANETLMVNLIDGPAYNLGAANTADGTITDDDTPVLTITDVSQNEGDSGTSNMVFTVQLDRPAPTGGVSYNYSVASITATAGSDFAAVGTLPGAISAGNTSQQHTVVINGDTDFEDDETFSFTVSGATQVAAAGNDFTATGTILNDDVSTLPSIFIADVSQNEGNSGGTTFTFDVNLNMPAGAGGATFDIATSNGTATVADNDYIALALTGQTIPAGSSSYAFSVTVNGDTTFESNETFNVTITPGAGIAGAGNDLAAVGTIVNDDITLSVQPTLSVTEGSAPGSANFAITIAANAIPFDTTTVNYQTLAGSALSGSDYASTSGTATITCAPGPAMPCGATVNVPIVGDLNDEPDETFTFTLSNPTGTGVSIGSATSTVTIVNDDVPAVEIWQIQGDGSRSPYEGQTVTTLGNVVTAVLPNGFMMQTPDARADTDFETSNAMLVFTGTNAPVLSQLAVGDQIDVRGSIIEFASNSTSFGVTRTKLVTEFTSAGLIVIKGAGSMPLPAPVTLNALIPSPDPTVPACDPDNDLNAGDPENGSFDLDPGAAVMADSALVRNFECLEGMRVTTTTGVIGSPNQAFVGSGDPYAEMTFTADGMRPFREPGVAFSVAGENGAVINLTPPAPPLPAGFVWDGNPNSFEIDVDKFQANHPNNVMVPGTTFSATGIIGIDFADYEFYVQTLNVNTAAPPLPTPVPNAQASELTVASLNVLRLYDYCDDPGTSSSNEPVNIADTDRKIVKLSVYIRTVMKSPDVIGIQETEIPSAPGTVCNNGQVTTSALQLLANRIAADGGPTYTVYNSPATHDPGRISVAFLVNPTRVSVTGTTQLRFNEQWTFTANGTPVTDDLHDRPPFLLEATTSVGGAPLPFAVMTNHLRSLGGIDDFVPEASDATPTADHENAHRVRRKKLHQAMAVACEAQAYQTAHPTRPLILVGDYNAFEFSDGYTDVNGIIRGDTDPAQSQYDIGFNGQTGGCAPQPNGQLVSPQLTEALFSLPAHQRYSYVFEGNAQELDHAFLNTAAQQRFVAFAYGRGNADAPAVEEFQPLITSPATQVLFASDHDGFVLRLNATSNSQPQSTAITNQTATEGDAIHRDVSASFSDPDTDTLTCTATGLPTALSISNNCIITGTIAIGAAAGSPYTVTVRATDPGGLFAEQSFTLTVNPAPILIFGNGFE
jgi:predicted extracellular nuclease